MRHDRRSASGPAPAPAIATLQRSVTVLWTLNQPAGVRKHSYAVLTLNKLSRIAHDTHGKNDDTVVCESGEPKMAQASTGEYARLARTEAPRIRTHRPTAPG